MIVSGDDYNSVKVDKKGVPLLEILSFYATLCADIL